MNRRGFLGSILAFGAAPAIVRIGNLMPVRSIAIASTEEVLAVTGATALGGGNTLLTIDMITREALRIVHAKMSFIGTINADYSSAFSKNQGDSIIVRRSQKYA